MVEIQKEKTESNKLNSIKQKIYSGSDKFFKGIETVLPKGRMGLASMRSTPQTNLSKEQKMLGELFGQKRQFWGNGQPVEISNTLTTGNGLLKTGSGDSTRRLFLP